MTDNNKKSKNERTKFSSVLQAVKLFENFDVEQLTLLSEMILDHLKVRKLLKQQKKKTAAKKEFTKKSSNQKKEKEPKKQITKKK
jgi:hypothetical protein